MTGPETLSRTAMHSALPHPNTYRVPGSRLIAGEYPFTEHPDSAQLKLQQFVRSGITCFLDLTEEGELHPYAPALRKLARAEELPVNYHRLPIRDMGIPDRERMRHPRHDRPCRGAGRDSLRALLGRRGKDWNSSGLLPRETWNRS